jgi:REP element-mobilizing transposase RayT
MLSTSSHVFSELFVHLNWHCKADQPMITPDLEARLYEHIERYCKKCKGVKFISVGGTPTHVHLLIQYEPFICLADWMGKVKGGSAHEMNKKASRVVLQWQRGYGAVSFGRHDLGGLTRYVREQKQHHATGRGKLNKTLELFGTFMETEYEEADA